MALTKSKNKKIAGVCAGLAEHFGFDVSMVRIAYIIATILTGSALAWIYLILMFVLPDAK
ncbi:MAG: PspC domain-containing protein [Paludibacteraceae bacterium]|nr:PspC domain-containing protein [Paludibacteraceae bacterium]MBR5237975.1 PspC domain-containing protein [Paludibacteraceae bacterium]MBR5823236.1 PspC domain-containing protein [Paludibacteraceae bacterium]